MKITIPEPCDQNWNEMQPCGLNRFCNKCDKQIIDFTFYSDVALTRIIKENEGRICGKFTIDQLDRELIAPKKKNSFFAKFSTSWFGFWLFLTSPFQTVKAQVQTEVAPVLKTSTKDTNQFVISGTVVDKNQDPLFGLKVKIVELGLKALTDIDGNFKFIFNKNSFESYSIEIWGFGFNDTIRINSISPNTADIKVVFPEDSLSKEMPMLGIVIIEPKLDVFEPKTWIPRSHKRSRKQ